MGNLNCSSISHDGSLVAGGFSDSSLKIWDMAKLGQEGYVSLGKESPAAPVFPLTSKTTKENAAIIGEKGVRG
ncbi:Transcription initiation factor TFIID subunit 5 [Morella rubra]|uniref:Transcription initiation factor TFIID subunit 5 n=1 Tax=Morella rubra TaxID=262757 RepID=A0A6A1UKE6_9ROSI|nr:Transcription initiation factor TFIID subunit 5 [Morella rubra]